MPLAAELSADIAVKRPFSHTSQWSSDGPLMGPPVGYCMCLTASISPSHPSRGTRHVSEKVILDVPAPTDTHGTEQLSRLAQPRLLSSDLLLF